MIKKTNRKEKMKFVFLILDKKFVVEASDFGKAMEQMNREVVDKMNLHPMAWFGNDDDKSIPVNTFKLVRGTFYD